MFGVSDDSFSGDLFVGRQLCWKDTLRFHVRNLGIQFDSTMSMDNHIKKVCQSSFFQIRNLSSLRKMLPKSVEILVSLKYSCMHLLHHAWITEMHY